MQRRARTESLAGDRAPPVLAVRNASKGYGAIQAVSNVSLEIRRGQILALCGENGAGKSSLVKLLTGVIEPDAGEVIVDGREVRLRSPRDAQAAGVALVSQELSICPDLSVFDNVWLGHARVPWLHRRRALRDKARYALGLVGATAHFDTLAGSLALGERQLIEIARMLLRDARVLILDEPTATLTDVEIDRVFAALLRVRQEGRSIILVTHRLAEVFRLCDRVVVLRNGELVADRLIEGLDRDGLIALMLGRTLERTQRRTKATAGDIALVARRLHLPGAFGPIDLTLRRGLIVSLVGQLGAGASDIVRAIAGLVPEVLGSVSAAGKRLVPGSVKSALAQHVLFITGDRAEEGMFQQLSVQDNLVATRLGQLRRHGVVRTREIRKAALGLAGAVGIDQRRLPSRVNELSGGNQQKIAFGRCVGHGAAGVLAMVEPTRGIDIGARSDIYARMREFCNEGHALLIASTDLEEVMAISDVVITLYRGQVIGEHHIADITMAQMVREITHPIDAAA